MQSFEDFEQTYLPRLRPEGVEQRVCYALRIDQQFLAAFSVFRRVLRAEIERWPDQIVLQLMQFRKLSDTFDDDDMARLRALYQDHRKSIMTGRFDAAYFTTIERLALFFIFHDIRAIWVTGAVKRTVQETMERIYNDSAGDSRGAMVFTLMNFLILELNQIERVYIRYSEITDAVSAEPKDNITIAS